MRFFSAFVRNGRLVLDEPTELAEATHLELVSVDEVLSNGGDLLDAEERAELDRELLASIGEADARKTIDLVEAIAALRVKR